MEYAQVLENARKSIGPKCKVCPVCNALGCGNTIPGPGSKAPGKRCQRQLQGVAHHQAEHGYLCGEHAY